MIETDRLFIRRFEAGDYNDLFEYLSVPAIYAYEPGKPVSLEEARELALHRSKGTDFLAVVLKCEKKMIGHLYFKPIEPEAKMTWELGYIFNPKYQRNGYASEASKAVTDWALASHKVHRIMARCNPENTASWKLLEKIGFVREGHFRKCGFVHRHHDGSPIWTDAYEYSKLES